MDSQPIRSVKDVRESVYKEEEEDGEEVPDELNDDINENS